MANRLKERKSSKNQKLAISFLLKAMDRQLALEETVEFLQKSLSRNIKCQGFPDFSPQNRDEFSGYINHLNDVFGEFEFNIGSTFSVNKFVGSNIQIKGNHNETFIGLAAIESQLPLSVTAIFKLRKKVIDATWIYNRRVTLLTQHGDFFQLVTESQF